MQSGGSLYGFADSMQFNSIEVEEDACFIVLSYNLQPNKLWK